MLNDKNKKYYVPNLIKTIKILELLSQSSIPLTQKEISKATEFTTSIVFRILTTLEDCEYLIKDEQRRYSVSKRFTPISYAATNEDNLIKHSSDIMENIRDTLMETTMMGVLVDGIFPIIMQEQGKHSFSFHCKIGTRCPLNTGAACKAVIANLPQKERDEIIANMDFEKFNERTITTKNAYLKELENVRKLGYGLDREEYIRGMHCVAAPIFNERAYPVAAIWITGPVERMPESSFKKTGEFLKQQTLIISKRLGFSGKI